MALLADELLAEWLAWSPAEIAAVLFAVLYLVFAIRQNIWCWFCAGISTALYIWLFFGARLYMESALNVFYFAMAIYGWYSWSKGGGEDGELPVTKWPVRIHLTALAGIAILVGVTGSWLAANTDAAYPYVDSATTYAAVWATFLVARKVLENWYYWLVIDVVSIFIYWSRDLELTSLLFVAYVIMIPFGIINWTRSWRAGPQVSPT